MNGLSFLSLFRWQRHLLPKRCFLPRFDNGEGIAWAFSSVGESAVLIRLRSLVRIQQGPPSIPEQVFGCALNLTKSINTHKERGIETRQPRASEDAQEDNRARGMPWRRGADEGRCLAPKATGRGLAPFDPSVSEWGNPTRKGDPSGRPAGELKHLSTLGREINMRFPQ